MAWCKDFKSLQSSLIAVSGCWLKMLSIWHKIMTTVSSVNTWWFVTDFSDCLTCFISDSHTPLIRGLVGGGLNFHSILHGLNFDVTKSKLIFFSANLNSFSLLNMWIVSHIFCYFLTLIRFSWMFWHIWVQNNLSLFY